MNPKVSVIIPCFNLGNYIDEAVNSVLNQTFQDFEIIIVNDGSTDKFTNDLLSDYAKPKTKIFTRRNHGLPSTRNFGTKKSKGDYLLFLDADDKIEKTYLEKSVKLLDKNKDISFISPWIQEFGLRNNLYKTKIDSKTILAENTVCVCSLIRAKDLKEIGGYDETMIHGYEDWDLWISFLEKEYKGKVLEEPLFLYRIRENSMLAGSEEKRMSLISYILNKHNEFLKQNYLEFILHKENQITYYLNSEKTNYSKIQKLKDKLMNKKVLINNLKEEISFEKQKVNELEEILKSKNEELTNFYYSKAHRLGKTLKYEPLSTRKLLKVSYLTGAIVTPNKIKSIMNPLIKKLKKRL